MSRLEALLFDVDGTLADTERGHLRAFNQAFADAGLDWEWSVDLYRELLAVTGGRERIRHFVERYRPDFTPPEPLDAFIAGLHRAKTRHYVGLVDGGGLGLRPGVERLLREARGEGLRLAIATTTTPDNVEALLRNTLGADAMDWFEVIGAGSVVPAKKPAPDIYHHVLAGMGLAPAACMAFEDSGPGVRAARGADLPVVVTVNDFTRDHDLSGASLVLDGFGEPQAPFRVLAGDAGDSRWLDVDLVRRVHAGAAVPA